MMICLDGTNLISVILYVAQPFETNWILKAHNANLLRETSLMQCQCQSCIQLQFLVHFVRNVFFRAVGCIFGELLNNSPLFPVSIITLEVSLAFWHWIDNYIKYLYI